MGFISLSWFIYLFYFRCFQDDAMVLPQLVTVWKTSYLYEKWYTNKVWLAHERNIKQDVIDAASLRLAVRAVRAFCTLSLFPHTSNRAILCSSTTCLSPVRPPLSTSVSLSDCLTSQPVNEKEKEAEVRANTHTEPLCTLPAASTTDQCGQFLLSETSVILFCVSSDSLSVPVSLSLSLPSGCTR